MEGIECGIGVERMRKRKHNNFVCQDSSRKRRYM